MAIIAHNIPSLVLQKIPVYDAVKFERVMKGGSTRPWQVTVDTGDQLKPYVVKLYAKEKKQHYNHPVRNEVIASAIAEEFSLSIPHFAFIKFPKFFVESLDVDQREQLKNADSRLKFSTELIEPNYPYTTAFKESDLEVYDLESIYAFDNLILNVDRRQKKHNILFDEFTYYLIDHEQTLHLQRGDVHPKTFLSRCNFRNHLFFEHLVKLNKRGQLEGFNLFEELLSLFRVNKLQPYINDLDEADYNIDECFRVINYLQNLKRNSAHFVNIIRETVSHD